MKVSIPPRGGPARTLTFAFIGVLASGHAAADVPAYFNVEGRLANVSGGPAPDGQYGVLFSLWSAESGGEKLWEEQHSGADSLSVLDGHFVAALGALTALTPGYFVTPVWVQFQVGLEPPLPRVPVQATPYALVAQRALTADTVSGGVTCTGCVGPGALNFVPATAAQLDAVTQSLGGTAAALSDLADDVASLEGALAAHVADPNAHQPPFGAADAVAAVEDENGLTFGGSLSLSLNELKDARLQVSATEPAPCGVATTGLVYFDTAQKSVLVCDGKSFLPIGTNAMYGQTPANPANSCLSIKNTLGSVNSGPYWLGGPTGSYQVYCDMTTLGGGWTLLMKAGGTTYPYESAHWSTSSIDNAGSVDETKASAKFEAFNSMTVSELLLKSEYGASTKLLLPAAKTLLQYFQGSTTVISYDSGAATVGALINGKSWTYCGAPWRINTFNPAFDPANAKIRLGGWVTSVWDCSYGPDQAGQPTGAHLLGFGLTDTRWTPFAYNRKSFGIRDAHDQNYLAPGQLESFGMIFGR